MILPLAGTGPIDGEIKTDEALITLHCKVALSPMCIDPGLMLNSSNKGRSATDGTWFTDIVTERDTVQHGLLAVIV